MVSRNLILATIVVLVGNCMTATAFAPQTSSVAAPRATQLNIFNKKKEDVDFSDIEVRDLTRKEMLEINKQNEEIMNMELGMMVSFWMKRRPKGTPSLL